ncbi:MAG TPA: hypothetical protein VGN16_14640 [Acidobacteriaceae bacterium]|jgi:hypothetical protein
MRSQNARRIPLGENPSWRAIDSVAGAAAVMDDPVEVETMQMLATPEWQLARRVAESKALGKSELLPRFLLHVCELTLRGRAEEITEQRIGSLIFNRPAGYNPGEDNIVRSYARMLRKRLEEYFAGEGRAEPMRIVIPRGGYVPVFQPATAGRSKEPREALSQPGTATEPIPTGADSLPVAEQPAVSHAAVAQSFSRRTVLLAALAGLLAGILLMAGIWFRLNAVQTSRAQPVAHILWNEMFQQNRNTLIVPADAGLGILQNLARRQISMEDYANGSYLSDLNPPPGLDMGNFNDLRRQRYTSIADLAITARLSRLPEYVPSRTEIRYSRSMTADDMKGANVILIGSKHSNPWSELFEPRMNFRFAYTPTVDQSWIVNTAPAANEEKIYRNGVEGVSSHTYGTVAYLPGLDGNNHVLIIQGLNMAATQGAAEILFDADAIRPVLQQATLPNGHLRSFELLIETTSIGATAPGAHILATRIENP